MGCDRIVKNLKESMEKILCKKGSGRSREMKNLRKIAASAAVLTMAVSLFAGCGSNGGDDKTLTMATNAAFPPYEYVEGGEVVGIDAEIAAALAEELGMELEIADVEFDSIVAGVASGKYDMGMAGITVDEERKKSVNFTDSYATGVQVVIVKEGSAIQTVDDLSSETKIGVQQGTTGAQYAAEDYGQDAVVNFNKGADAVQALLTDKVDCVIIDNEPAKSFVAANEGLKILDTEYTVEDYAICVNKDNDELLKKLNDALDKLKEDGTIDKIIQKYIPADGE